MAVSYSNLRDDLKTGDVVLFSGKGFISNLIKFATRSKWSHVGMVVKIAGFDFVALWESTTLSNIKDINTGEFKRGVQLVPLSERVNQYSGDIAVRRLNKSLSLEQMSKLSDFRKQMQGTAYESKNIELIKSSLDHLGALALNQEDLSTVFCSELVAEAYQLLSLLSDDTPSNEYTPSDFASDNLELKNGYELGELLMVRCN